MLHLYYCIVKNLLLLPVQPAANKEGFGLIEAAPLESYFFLIARSLSAWSEVHWQRCTLTSYQPANKVNTQLLQWWQRNLDLEEHLNNNKLSTIIILHFPKLLKLAVLRV